MSPPERAGLPGKEALSATLYFRNCTRNVNNNVLGWGGVSCFLSFFMLFVYLELGHFLCFDYFSFTIFSVWGKSRPWFLFLLVALFTALEKI